MAQLNLVDFDITDGLTPQQVEKLNTNFRLINLKLNKLIGESTEASITQQYNYTFGDKVSKSGDTMTGSLNMSGKSIAGVGNIEMNHGVSTAGHGGYIDFHYNASTADYTARLIEAASGLIRCYNNFETSNGFLKATKNNNTVTIGSANTNWCHIENSANIPFYFNRNVHVAGDIYKYNGPRVQYVPTVLYNNTTGTNGTVTLSQTAANFNHMRIYFREIRKPLTSSVDVYGPNGKTVALSVALVDGEYAYNQCKTAAISGKTVSITSGYGWFGKNTSAATTVNQNNIFITRIEGWNE